uniref:Uncharacterized protein n=1 Tax=Octopus bimaculoides TaxID=37653 RepID=A0A0L8GQB2_OCTBM
MSNSMVLCPTSKNKLFIVLTSLCICCKFKYRPERLLAFPIICEVDERKVAPCEIAGRGRSATWLGVGSIHLHSFIYFFLKFVGWGFY